ncbi:lonely Cys domain-containing protein [Streptomyces mayonensis]|uniref:lonely Cys domain-containing protein n=1 Tax=Streptomyces mayonensis TaxID=2750816 RepID=UPI001C1E5227|nr:lonely Cys domain-containing protein [Streptomyces sp. A108]MBU6535496.1 lonely Cys domain-containing protein [Streptomyces sp. A108]
MPGDGDCLPRALRDSLKAQRPRAFGAAFTVQWIRQRAVTWYRSPAAASLRELHAAPDPLETLVLDGFRDLESLLTLLGRSGPPELTAEQRDRISERLTDSRRRAELLALSAGGEDRTLLADLPRDAVRALLPAEPTVPESEIEAERQRLTAQAQVQGLRAEVLRRLRAPGGDADADTLWQRILGSLPYEVPYRRTAFVALRYDELVERSLASPALWRTPFYDEAPLLFARSLDLSPVLVQPVGSDGYLTHRLDPGSTDPAVYLYYNGRDHYEALAPTGTVAPSPASAPSPAPAPRTAQKPVGPAPDQAARDRLADLARRHGASEDYVRRLTTGLSAQALAAMPGAVRRRPEEMLRSSRPHASRPGPVPTAPVMSESGSSDMSMGSSEDEQRQLVPDSQRRAMERLFAAVDPAVESQDGALEALLERLDRLRRQHPALRRGGFDLAELTRGVLHLDPGEALTDYTITELLRVAAQRPQAQSLAELSAYHLATFGEGLFADRYRLPAGAQGRPSGWNWHPEGVPADADLSVAAQVVERADGMLEETLVPAPWGPAYLYSASSGVSWISLPGFGGRMRRVPFEVFTEVPAFDPDAARVPEGTDRLLAMSAVSSRGIHLADGLVARYGVNVLSTSGRLGWTRPDGDSDRSVLAITARERQDPLGGWLRRDPETVRAAAARGLGDAAYWSRNLSYWPIIGSDHRLIGYISMDFAEEGDGGWKTTSFYARFTAGRPAEKYVIRYDEGERVEARPVPWVVQNLPTPVFGVAHGLAGCTAWHTPHGTLTTSGPESGRRVAALVALTGLPDNHPFVMDHCYGEMPRQPGTLGEEGESVHDTDPRGADPLVDRSEAEHVADALRKTVFSQRYESTTAFTAMAIPGIGADEGVFEVGLDQRFQGVDPQNAWAVVRPRPQSEALDALARAMGLHQRPGLVSEEVRERTLGLVHVLRRVFRPLKDRSGNYRALDEHALLLRDPGDPRGHLSRVLVRGIGALELMRQRDAQLNRPGAPLFTTDLLELLWEKHRVLSGESGPAAELSSADRQRSYGKLLENAVSAWAEQPALGLTQWIALPEVSRALETLGSADAPRVLAREALGLPEDAPVAELEWSHLLWAEVKAARIVGWDADDTAKGEFARTVLRLDHPAPERFPQAHSAAVRAITAGRDPGDLSALASHGLESAGVLTSGALVADSDEDVWARDFTGQLTGGDFDHTVITLMKRMPDGSIVPDRHVTAPWYDEDEPDNPVPFVYVAEEGYAPAGVFADLAYRDPRLRALDAPPEGILAIGRAMPPGDDLVVDSLPAQAALNTSKDWYACTHPVELYRDAQGVITLAVHPEEGSFTVPEETWGYVRYRDVRDEIAGTSSNAGSPSADAYLDPAPPHAHRPGRSAVTEPPSRALPPVGPDPTAVASSARAAVGPVPPRPLSRAELNERAPAAPAPAVSRDLVHRRWLARQVTAADVPPGLPTPGTDESVGRDDVDAAGLKLSQRHQSQTVLRGDGRLFLDSFEPHEQARLRMVLSDSWPQALEETAANVARRLWASAYEEFAAPHNAPEADARAWSRAVSLVLPQDSPDVRADSRCAGPEFRDAVRQVAEHMLDEERQGRPASGIELADSLRAELGLRERRVRTSELEPDDGGTFPAPAGNVVPSGPAPATASAGTVATSAGPVPVAPITSDGGAPAGGAAAPRSPSVRFSGARGSTTRSELDPPSVDQAPTAVPEPASLPGTPTSPPSPPGGTPASTPTGTPVPTGAPYAPSFGRPRTGLAAPSAPDPATAPATAPASAVSAGRTAAGPWEGKWGDTAPSETDARQVYTRPAGPTPPQARLSGSSFASLPAPSHPVPPAAGSPMEVSAPEGELTQEELEEHDEDILAEAFGEPGDFPDGARQALRLLDRLRDEDPELAGPALLDAEAVARQVLMLEPDEEVMAEELASLVELAAERPQAGSLAELSAFHLTRKGAFGPEFRYTDADGNDLGWDWSESLPAELDPSSAAVQTYARTSGPAPGETVGTGAWWRQDRAEGAAPYILGAESGPSWVRILGRRVPFAVLIELMALNPDKRRLGADSHVLLYMSNVIAWGLELQDGLVARYDWTVWATDSTVKCLVPAGDGRGRPVIALSFQEGYGPVGGWLVRSPGTVGSASAATGQQGGVAVKWGRKMIARPVIGPDHRLAAFLAVDLDTDGDKGYKRTYRAARILRTRRWVTDHIDSAPWDLQQVPWLSMGLPLPIPLLFHSEASGVIWPVDTGVFSQRDRTENLRRIAFLVEQFGLPPKHPLLIVGCLFGTSGSATGHRIQSPPLYDGVPVGVNPLDDVSQAEFVADGMDRWVFASPQPISMAEIGALPQELAAMPDEPIFVLSTDQRVRRTRWTIGRPPPKGRVLDELAHRAHLPVGRPDTRERTLRLWRAMVRAFGPLADREGQFWAMWSGIGALERMREADGALNRPGARRFTMELFDYLASERPHSGPLQLPQGVTGQHLSGAALTRRGRLLLQAAAVWDAKRDVPLSDWLPTEPVTRALEWLESLPDAAAGIRSILGLDATTPVGEHEASRVIWADVRTDLAARWQLIPDPVRFPADVVIRAAAAGRNVTSAGELGSHVLEQAGALSSATVLRDGEGKSWGRHFSGGARQPGNFNHRVITLLQPGDDGSPVAVGTEQAPWYANESTLKPFVYDGDPSFASPGEFGDLAYRDPELRTRDLYTPAIAAFPHVMPPGPAVAGSLPGELADNTNKVWWASTAAARLFYDENQREYTVAVLLAPGAPRTARDTWRGILPDMGVLPPHGASTTHSAPPSASAYASPPAPTPPASTRISVNSQPDAPQVYARPVTEAEDRPGASRAQAPRGPGQALTGVLTRERLEDLVDQVADQGPSGEPRLGACAALVRGLAGAVFPSSEVGALEGGARAAVALDDLAVGRTPTEHALAAGPGWASVQAWAQVERGLKKSGPGSLALVLGRRQDGRRDGTGVRTSRPGHAWAAYLLADRSVVWVDLLQARGSRLSSTPKSLSGAQLLREQGRGRSPLELPPLEGRAVIVAPSGRVQPDALPPFAQSSDTGSSVVDAATDRSYAGEGVEDEDTREVIFERRSGDPEDLAPQVLAVGPGLKAVVDKGRFYRDPGTGNLRRTPPEVPPGEKLPDAEMAYIVEFVVDRMKVLDGEQGQTLDEGLSALERAKSELRLVDVLGKALPLGDLLRQDEGWELTDLGERAKIQPRLPDAGDGTHVQVTAGVSTLGLRAVQLQAVRRLNEPPLEEVVRKGIEFGRVLARQYVLGLIDEDDRASRVDGLMPFLAAVPDVEEMWGYSSLLFNEMAAEPSAVLAGNVLTKHFLAAASRHSFERVRRALRPSTRQFLQDHVDRINEVAAGHLMELVEQLRQNLKDFGKAPVNLFDITPRYADPSVKPANPREKMNAGLTGRMSSGKRLHRRDGAGMVEFGALDTDSGRLQVPLILVELRQYGFHRLTTPEELRRLAEELADLLRQDYERAKTHRLPLSEDELRESVSRILDSEAVRKLAPFLWLVLEGLPLADGERHVLLDTWTASDIASAVGAWTLGTPLPEKLQQRLHGAVQDAESRLRNLSRRDKAQIVPLVDDAWAALEELADPEGLPEPVRRDTAVEAADGELVPLDQIAVAPHRGVGGEPVAVSSGSAGDRAGWQQFFSRLPFSMPRKPESEGGDKGVPAVTGERAAPFAKAFGLGFKAEAGLVQLTLKSGAVKQFSYPALIDVLHALAPDLRARTTNTVAAVMGVDLVAPASADPAARDRLEHPVAGQYVATQWDRWAFGTASGQEPRVVDLGPGQNPSVRFELAEGDRWVAFRPDPGQPELHALSKRITGGQAAPERVLRWVRAIRLIYGPRLETDRAAFDGLLRGFRELDQLRASRGDRAPLTWRALVRLASTHAGSGRPVPPLAQGLPAMMLSLGVDLRSYDLTPAQAPLRAEQGAAQGPTSRGGDAGPGPLSLPVRTASPPH